MAISHLVFENCTNSYFRLRPHLRPRLLLAAFSKLSLYPFLSRAIDSGVIATTTLISIITLYLARRRQKRDSYAGYSSLLSGKNTNTTSYGAIASSSSTPPTPPLEPAADDDESEDTLCPEEDAPAAITLIDLARFLAFFQVALYIFALSVGLHSNDGTLQQGLNALHISYAVSVAIWVPYLFESSTCMLIYILVPNL